MKKSWTRKKIMRVVIAPLFVVLAVAACVMGVLNLTILKPSNITTASATTSTNYVVTNSGVADLLGHEVSVTATTKKSAAASQTTTDEKKADKNTVCLAVGTDTDVDAWMKSQGVAYTAVSGLSSWTQLSTQSVAKTGAAAKDAVAMNESDLWRDIKCSESTATLRLDGVQAGEKVIVYSPSGVSSVRLQWVRQNLPNTSVPWFSAAAVLLVIAILAFTWLSGDDPFGSKRRQEARAAAAAAGSQEEGAGVPGVDAPYVPYQKKSTSGITHRTRKKGLFGKLFAGKKDNQSDTSADSQNPSVAAQSSQPIIVDPSSVNLVASTGAGANDTAWSWQLLIILLQQLHILHQWEKIHKQVCLAKSFWSILLV